MSEYQYYEFQAIDRPLTTQEQAMLRNYSSRATITSSRFVVDYSWGDFKGNAAEWMETYFDAFLYLASWGSHELMLRLPRNVLRLETAEQYCAGDFASARARGDFLVLAFRSDDEEGGEWIDEDNDTLASLLPVRAELVSGDLRALYIAWLGCAQAGELEDEDLEPPCPPGLGKLSPALEAFANFLRIDDDLIETAATASAELGVTDGAALEAWVAALPEEQKTSILIRLVGGAEASLRGEILRNFRESHAANTPAAKSNARTVGDLLKAAEGRANERRRQEAERGAREKARRQREAAEARDCYLTSLAKREAQAWRDVDALIATKQPKKYDEAVVLLRDLRDVCVRAGRHGDAVTRIARLLEEHAKKASLIDRFRKAALL
ncbi:MAG: hypothetical protein HY319_07515 [Armatimonadetes bacterium]|nr:hypothetical protein [Armatimonadota bacterium]